MSRLVVISAGLSVPSSTRLLADQLAGASREALASRGDDAEITVVELREHAHALADHLLTGFASGGLADAIEAVRNADALIVVTPVFSASYSGLFKTFFDVLEPGLIEGKPVLMAATAGTARHSLVLEHALRPLFSYLKARPLATSVFAATEDFGSTADGRLAQRVRRVAVELADELHRDGGSGARQTARASVRAADSPGAAPAPARGVPAGFDPAADDFVSFEDLLRS